MKPSRRAVVSGLAAATLVPGRTEAGDQKGYDPKPFGFEDVERRARDLAGAAFDARIPALPAPLANLDYDAWRDIRFKPAQALPLSDATPFRLQLFHLGFLYKRPVTVNLIRGGVPTPIPYRTDLYDFGRTRLEGPLPVGLGFAGLRLHTTLNRPNLLDELIVFLGASYYRFLGRDQIYGLSARGLAVNVEGEGGPEEFPFFREFWVSVPERASEACVIHALLDGPSQTGAFAFTVRPGEETTVSVHATLYPRRELAAIGLAPLTSMFFVGENDRRQADPYRAELHDSDGLQIAAGNGEWLWRPIANPAQRRFSSFADRDPRGFGLLQRDRTFTNYQDLEASYERRPGYFVEPEGDWGEGDVVLLELPTDNETADNVVAFWRPRRPYPVNEPVRFAYRVRAVSGTRPFHPGARVLNTFVTDPTASGGPSGVSATRLAPRFLIDFGGGDLAYYLPDFSAVEVVASTVSGTIAATSLVPNPQIGGFRAAVDLRLASGEATEVRVFLRAGERALSETWTYPWSAA